MEGTIPAMNRLRCLGCAAVILLTATSVAAQDPPPVELSVTVTAAEFRRMEDSVKTIRGSRDPFLASISSHLITLAEALARPGERPRTVTIGPLTPSESGTIPIEDYLLKFQSAQGTIQIQFRINWEVRRQEVYKFTPSGFLALLAEIAKGPVVQVPIVQLQQILFLGRTIVDLNEQAGGVIPDSAIFSALATVFRDKRVGERVVALCAQMADDGRVYDLVPRDLVEDFQRRAEPGFLVPAQRSATRAIRLLYNEVAHVTRPDDLVWSYLRFFSGDNSGDWALQAAARTRAVLGKQTLDYLEAQVYMQVIEAFSARLAAAEPGQDVSLGDYLEGGVVMAFLKSAPLTTRVTVTPGERRVTVGVEASRINDLRGWLDAARKKVTG
jgi:hypothetical protein